MRHNEKSENIEADFCKQIMENMRWKAFYQQGTASSLRPLSGTFLRPARPLRGDAPVHRVSPGREQHADARRELLGRYRCAVCRDHADAKVPERQGPLHIRDMEQGRDSWQVALRNWRGAEVRRIL